MSIYKKRIVFTGGSGRFGSLLKKNKFKYKVFFPSKKNLNVEKIDSIKKYVKKVKPNIIVHMAALSRPMNIHDKDIIKSINLNIIGTANVTNVCSANRIKLIYFSTCYVYPGIKGNYKENDALLPFNNYSWSKLGGECAVQMYKNSLILRICMTEKPFTHDKAFVDVKTNFIFHEEVVKILFKVLDRKGIINVGGKIQSVFNFAKKYNKDIKKIYAEGNNFPLNPSMNISKLKSII